MSYFSWCRCICTCHGCTEQYKGLVEALCAYIEEDRQFLGICLALQLLFESSEDVCLLPPKVGLEFYHTARNALVLYEAIIPVKLQRQLDSFNQAAVLIHNDCLYLSQETLGLAFEYRPYFPSSLKELAVFIDLAPRFQLMAEEVLQRQIQLFIHNLKQAIDGADGFQNTHQIK